MRMYLWNINWYHWYIEARTSLTIERLSYLVEKKIVNVVFEPDQWILFFVGSESTSGNISIFLFTIRAYLCYLTHKGAKFFLHLRNIDKLKDDGRKEKCRLDCYQTFRVTFTRNAGKILNITDCGILGLKGSDNFVPLNSQVPWGISLFWLPCILP